MIINQHNLKQTDIKIDIFGNYFIRYPDGDTREIRTSLMGDVTITDSNGEITTIKRDLSGNYLIEKAVDTGLHW